MRKLSVRVAETRINADEFVARLLKQVADIEIELVTGDLRVEDECWYQGRKSMALEVLKEIGSIIAPLSMENA